MTRARLARWRPISTAMSSAESIMRLYLVRSHSSCSGRRVATALRSPGGYGPVGTCLAWLIPYANPGGTAAKNVIGLIDSSGAARAAVRDLVESGIAQDDIGFMADQRHE